jgi:hypothetical protein
MLWFDFFFKPVSPAPFCLFRIFFGLIVLVSFIDCLPSATALFGSDGVTSQALVSSLQHGCRLGLFYLFSPSTVCVLGTMLVLILASITLTIGWHTRISAFIVWFLLLSFRNRNPYVWNCGDDLIQIVSLLMFLGPSGVMYSVDAWIKSKHTDHAEQAENKVEPQCPPWAQRLVQIQLCVVYAVSFFCKSGRTWHDGTAVYYAMHIRFFTHFFPPYLFDHLWTCQLISWSTLAIEFSLFTLIWVKPCRSFVLAIGVCMHLCMLLCMNLHVLELIILACYINFIDAQTVKRLVTLSVAKVNVAAKTMSGIRRLTGGA